MAQRETSRFPYTITDALFIPGEGNRFEIVVIGRGFVRRAVPIGAQLGQQEVGNISIRSDGTSFSGRLERAPSPGDRLAVGYMDEGLRQTRIVYRGVERPVA